jgi:hypothetical protein
MEVLRFIALFIVLSSGILFLTRKLHFSQSLAPLVTILGITIILYICSLAGILLQGAIFVIILSLILGILSFIHFSKKIPEKKWAPSPALLVWIIAFIIIAIYTFGTLFYRWDEFSYWGTIYKYLLATNHLPDVASNFLVTSYPPFVSLFQYFIGLVLGNKESSAYFAQMIMDYSAIIAILPVNDWHNWKKYLLAFSLCVFSVFFFGFEFQTIYVDLLMGLIFAAGLSSAVFNQNFSIDRIILVIFVSIALILSKPLGTCFAIVCIALIYFEYLWKNYEINSIRTFLQSLFKPLLKPQFILLIVLPLLAALSWNIHAAQFNSTKVSFSLHGEAASFYDIFPLVPKHYVDNLYSQDALERLNHYLLNKPLVINISLTELLKTFSVHAPYRTSLIIKNFINTISPKINQPSNLTILNMLIIFLLLSYFSTKLKSNKIIGEKNSLRINLVLLAGLLLYSLLLLFAYIYYFGPEEGLVAPALYRYIGPYLLGWFLLIICTIYLQNSFKIPFLNINASDALNSILLLVMIVIIPFSSYFHTAQTPSPDRFKVDQVYQEVENKISSKDKVYDVWQINSDSGFYHYVMKYYLTPIPTNNYGWQLGKAISIKDIYSAPITQEEWLQLLNEQHYTLVLISSSDNQFWKQYGNIFDTYDKANIPQLFSVTPDKLIRVPLNN